MTAKLFLGVASAYGFLGVALGAFGAHALKGSLDSYSKGVYETATLYLFVHGIALLFVGEASLESLSTPLKWGGLCFIFGSFIFSGSLYALAITKIKTLGAITPIGGLFLLVGWIALMVHFLATKSIS